jgi:hypothetical protein
MVTYRQNHNLKNSNNIKFDNNNRQTKLKQRQHMVNTRQQNEKIIKYNKIQQKIKQQMTTSPRHITNKRQQQTCEITNKHIATHTCQTNMYQSSNIVFESPNALKHIVNK